MLYWNLHQWKVEGKRCTYNVNLCKMIIFLSIRFFDWVTKIEFEYRGWGIVENWSWIWIPNNTIKTFTTLLVLISKAYYLNSHYVCGHRNKRFGNVKMWKMISVTFIKGFRFPKIIVSSRLKFSVDNFALLPVTSYLKSSMSFTIDNILWHALIPLDNKEKLS